VPVFERRGIEGTARWFLLANGLLIPFLVGQIYFNVLLWPATAWAVTFPGATWSLAMLFRSLRVEGAAAAQGVASRP